MRRLPFRLPASWITLVWLGTGCAQDAGFLAEGWEEAPAAQRVLVLPTNFDDPPPNFLAAATERVTDEVEARVRASGRECERVSTSEALDAGSTVVRGLDLGRSYEPATARPHLAAHLARLHDVDLVLLPEIVVRDAVSREGVFFWDGARDAYRKGIGADLSGSQVAISVRIQGFDRSGREVVRSYGGIEAVYRLEIYADGSYQVTLRDDLLENAGNLRQGVDLAVAPLLGPATDEREPPADEPSGARGGYWKRAAHGPFVIMTNDSKEKAESIARRASQFLAVSEEATGLKLDVDQPVEIIAFRSESEFRSHHGRGELGHAFVTHTGMRVAFPSESALFRIPVLFHELVHVLLFQDASTTYPAWYHEGLAEMLGTMTIQGDIASLNMLPSHRLDELRTRPLPLDELLERRSFADLAGDDAARFYADAWAFVAFLHTSDLRGGEDLRAPLRAMLAKLSNGMPWREALESSFQREVASLEADYRSFRRSLRRDGLPLRRYRIERAPEAPSFEYMDRFDAELALGRYVLAVSPDDLTPAAHHFEQAVRLRRRNTEAIAGLARTYFRAGLMERAGRMLALVDAEPAAEQPTDAAIEEARGEFWLTLHALDEDVPEPLPRDALAASGSEAPLVRARRHLSAAVREDAERTSAWRLLGATFALDPGAPAGPGLDALQRVAARLPALLDVQVELGILRARQGESEAARRHFEHALASHDTEIADRARAELTALGPRP